MRYFLELCLKSVQAAIYNLDAEIIVVDNNSADDSCKIVKGLFPNVKLIENKENLGFSKGNNIGILQAKGEYLCILNPDTVVAEDTFERLLEFVEKKEKLGIVGCKLINGVGDFLPESKRNIPYVKAAIKKLLGNTKDYYASHINENKSGKVDVLVGAFMFLKREVYNEIGGFDEDYFMYGEDIDLSYRILKKGYNNYYFGETTVIHFKGESTLKNRLYARRFYAAMQIFYKKHFKKNIFFDILVWLAIKLVSFFKKKLNIETKNIKKYIFISSTINEALKSVLSKDIIVSLDLSSIENDTEVIFDANFLSYKEIIDFMQSKRKSKLVTYKILPEKSKFVLGSDNALIRGEVIDFD
ncbi:Glycosyltransferase, GT2 family [Flaviramulus basaltis]|uniref:Glycosyltransferase, GT2 family n=1 Tax=Flaviramulus basaltis TaxID=369401 RepID=A0A1K2IN63_9FLAO|nr:Glycosyltransferase, GT2 family [Flaviramulus basaltis]